MLEAAKKRGHDIQLVHPSHLHVVVTSPSQESMVIGPQGPMALPDMIYTRVGSSGPPEAIDVLRYLFGQGIPCVNTSKGLLRSRDKLRSFQILAHHGLPLPQTALLSSQTPIASLLNNFPGPPWIIKLPLSTQGQGVMLLESQRSLLSAVGTLQSLGQRLLLQEFIQEAAGADLRVLVVGGKALAAMRRRSKGDDFRSNLHQGGSAQSVALTPDLCDIAERAASSLGLEVAGVDLLESNRGPLIIEVNGSPGLEGLSAATGRDLADEIVTYLEQRKNAPLPPEEVEQYL